MVLRFPPTWQKYLASNYISAGEYPSFFKTAKVSALFKGGDRSNQDNYRPISVLPQLNGIFEKLIHIKLTSFFNDSNVIASNQFGFQKGHSTAHAITTLNEKIAISIEKQKVSALLFIDLKSAFDTINHNILLKKTRPLWY